MNLVAQVPSGIRSHRSICNHLVGVESSLRQRLVRRWRRRRCCSFTTLRARCRRLLPADDVGNRLARRDAVGATLPPPAKGNLHVRLICGIRVVLRSLRELLGDDKLLLRNTATFHKLLQLPKVRMDRVHDILRTLSAQNLAQRVVPRILRERAPVAAHDVEALCLHLGREFAVRQVLVDNKRGVLLLLQKQHRLVNTVDVDFHAPVPLVHLLLHSVS
mmetsp:Transcript_8152/g.18493  ORF Transcript_8152/g.18493 Transcript_8152/m.18493 type:complete len:218 (+) Transcript_8152:1652-2305(+)